MIKTDIINNVAKTADITRVRAVVAVEAILDAMKESMRRGERIELTPCGDLHRLHGRLLDRVRGTLRCPLTIACGPATATSQEVYDRPRTSSW